MVLVRLCLPVPVAIQVAQAPRRGSRQVVAPTPRTAPRWHVPLAYGAVKVGYPTYPNVADEFPSLSHDLKADGWVSGPPRVVIWDQWLQPLTSPRTAVPSVGTILISDRVLIRRLWELDSM